MDQGQFTTTFIPKKPLTPEPVSTSGAPVSRPVGLLSTIAMILFFITILMAVGVYFWKGYMTNRVAVLADSITAVEKKFEPELITKLQTVDKQLRNANILLKNHIAVSPVFDMLESSALKQIRFSKFDIATDDKGTTVKMSGESDGYRSIASQSDLFGANAFLQNVIFSNFFLTQRGRVSFDLSFGVRPDFVDFEKAPIAGSVTSAPTQ